MLLVVSCGRLQPRNERDFDAYHFGDLKLLSPSQLARLDNNYEILAALAQPSSKASLLQRGTKVTDSQIELLILSGLLERQADLLVTRIPMLDQGETARLRALTSRAAGRVAEAARDSILEFKRELARRNQAGTAYPLFFSYILDGLVWERFRDMGLMRREDNTPLWSGEVWTVSPSRGVHPGTITFWHGKAVMYVMWTEGTAPVMTPFMGDDRKLRACFADCVERGRIENQGVRELFVPYGLVSESGECKFPIFSEDPGDSLFETADALARRVADQAASDLALGELAREFGFRDESQALVVAYHELMWDLLDELGRTGAITRPALLDEPSSADKAHVGNLVFVVRKPE
jgi:hypothetical protein